MADRPPAGPLLELQDGAELELPGLEPLPRYVLRTLLEAGHQAALVGGSLRDQLVAAPTVDWDVATSAPPEQVVALFPGASWENRFGTVTVHGPAAVQVTTYRGESGYRDRRRPDEVRFGVSLEEDLARRDFTINAVAWVPTDRAARMGRIADPHGGIDDLRAGILRAVGDPDTRFREDALRLLRAVRFAHRLRLRIEPGTEQAIARLAPLASGVSGERLRDELERVLHAPAQAVGGPPPSEALLLMERLGLLGKLLPELAALRGVPQDKAIPGDAFDHTLRAVDAADPQHPLERWAALLHDLGKADTLADGHFIGHEEVGAELAARVLARLRFRRRDADEVVHAVRHHMFAYDSSWTDAAVRRFVRRVGRERLDLLFRLRSADNRASGVGEAGESNQRELEARIRELFDGGAALEARDLAVDGHDLRRELGLDAGPRVGRILAQLTEAVVEDPALNDRDRLLELARRLAVEQAEGATRER